MYETFRDFTIIEIFSSTKNNIPLFNTQHIIYNVNFDLFNKLFLTFLKPI